MALIPITVYGNPFTNAETVFLQALADHSYTDGQLIIGNSSTGGVSFNTLTQGSGVTITNGHGTITIAASGAGSGTVTTVSVVSANGFAGTVANATSTPAITLSTTITGLLKGDGTAISAATAGTDYVTATSTNTFTNKTYDTAGTGNSFSIAGVAVTANTGTGAVARAAGSTFTTPTLGVASATTVNKVTITAPATGSTLTIADGKTLTVSNTLTFTGTDTSSVAFGTGGTVLYTTSTLPLAVGSTTIASGTTTKVLFDNAGVLGEYTISGSGNVAMTTSPVFTTPSLGVATATSVNGLIITTTTGTLTMTNAKTLAVTNSLTLSGTDATVMTFPTTTATIARTDAAQTFTGVQTFSSAPVLSTNTLTGNGNLMTFPGSAQTLVGRTDTVTLTNKRITRRVVTTTQSATPTVNSDNTDMASITGLAQAITSMTTNLSGTPVQGDFLEYQITDNGTARAITWGASFSASTIALPTTTVISTLLHVLFEWDATLKWVCVAVA